MNRSQAGSHANGHISSHLKARIAILTLGTFTNVHPQASPLDERIAFSRYTGRRARGQIYRKHQHKQLHGGWPSSTARPDLRFTTPFTISTLLSARTNVCVGQHRLLCCSIRSPERAQKSPHNAMSRTVMILSVGYVPRL